MEADPKRPPRLLAVLLALAALATAACSENTTPSSTPTKSDGKEDGGGAPPDARPAPPDAGPATPRIFTGEVEGTDAQMAAIVTTHHARFYFCGGDSTYMTLSRWIPANVASGDATADVTAGAGWTLRAGIEDRQLTGELMTGDAAAFSFHANVVDQRTLAGVYEAMSPCGKVGLIVTQPTTDDTPEGQGACIGTGNVDIHQVNPASPLVRASDGTIRVVVDGSGDEVSVTAAAPPAD